MKQVTRSTLARTKRMPPGRRRKETPAALRARARRIIARLERAYPGATCALQHRNALELLVATILSAQSTDARVNMVTPALFTKYRTAQDYASTDPKLFEEEIHSTGFFRNKTKSIIGMGLALVERHGGKVPDTMEQLVQLPGVGRKTANVVLGTWFGKNEGVVVDTHVQRLATLLALTREQDPVKIERDLMALVPRAKWTWLSHTLILHGRRVCIARRPKCEECVVSRWCPSSRV
ncbi:MAG TPA: endonuclease III [Gemmatimonadales bacterium]|nr:endonuclease III [Gemmatimonadales bacterium]